jgi:hypothetical protein
LVINQVVCVSYNDNSNLKQIADFLFFNYIYLTNYLSVLILKKNIMEFTGNESEQITLATAAEWTKNYRSTIPSGETLGHFFGMNMINSILAQTGVVGIRMYYALDNNGAKQLIMVGTDANQNDLYEGIIADKSTSCPPFCGGGNPLNS